MLDNKIREINALLLMFFDILFKLFMYLFDKYLYK